MIPSAVSPGLDKRARRRRRLLPLALGLAVAAVVVVLLAGGSSHSGPPTAGPAAPSEAPAPAARPVARLARHRLPEPLSGEAVVAEGGRILVVGGLDAEDVSTSQVLSLDPSTGRFAPIAPLSEARHDTAATALGGTVYVFAGGSASELDSVESLSPGGAWTTVGSLPTTRSDLSALSVAGRAYVLGGYDGQAPLKPVLATRDGRRFPVAGDLPVPFRYAATAAVGPTIYTFGGELASGLDTDAIQAFDTTSGRARVVGHLPEPLSHASAVALGGRIYVLGGSSREAVSDRILSFTPPAGAVHSVGRLPFPVTNAAAAALGGTGYLVGGLDPEGGWLDSVIEVRLSE
jgi:N-acetylneuraminic acid mutarotase